ncbi:MAG: FHA domain-containing protein [Candidatus Roseilinea sp.]|uniref:FHA domain-containing protein n=1 Tax=Candidatus Roseilinea sp. TaxID=2838777 RepID=UPI00404A43DA
MQAAAAFSSSVSSSEVILLILRILIVAVLYAFLGLILWLLVRERHSPQTPVPLARLTPLLTDGAPASAHILRSAVWIGRDPNCAVRVSDEYASARHARLAWDPATGAWWIEDNASRTGTWVNEERVLRCALGAGDIIRVGEVRFRFET